MTRGLSLAYWTHLRVDRSWMKRAACRGMNTEFWFPDTLRRYDRRVQRYAQGICARCPVRTDCLDYAITIDARHGIFGGLTGRQRVALTGRRPY